MYIINKLRNPIMWTKTSESILQILLKFIKKNYRVMEVGSGTGHISFLLAKMGFKITLNDIREDVLKQSLKIFKSKKVPVNFIEGDIFKVRDIFDFCWSSGLIQCFNDKNKKNLIKKLSQISKRVMLIYPDTEDKGKVRGKNRNKIPGVDDATEYDVNKIPEFMNKFFKTVYFGELSKEEIGLNYKMFWVYGVK